MIGHICRVCAGTLAHGANNPDFSTVVSDIVRLHDECEEVEANLCDSFNAFCFTCRRITMSVPGEVTPSEQVCYLRAQVNWFNQLRMCGLFAPDHRRHSSDDPADEMVELDDEVEDVCGVDDENDDIQKDDIQKDVVLSVVVATEVRPGTTSNVMVPFVTVSFVGGVK